MTVQFILPNFHKVNTCQVDLRYACGYHQQCTLIALYRPAHTMETSAWLTSGYPAPEHRLFQTQ